MNKKPSIYTFKDPLAYLKAMIAYSKKTNPAFSYRYFAKKAGFASQSAFKFIVDGERGLTQESIRKIAKGFKLTQNQTDYLELMVGFFQEKEPHKKNTFYTRMLQEQKKQKIKNLSSDHYEYFSNWYHPAIRELIRSSDCKNNPKWIANKLFPKITERQAQQSINLLLRLGLIKKNAKGSFEQTTRALSTDPEIQSMIVRNFHKEMGQKAIYALDEIAPSLRDISGITFGLPASKLKDLKAQIATFRKELTSTLGSLEEETEDVYHLNIQLFPLTKKEEEK